MSVATEDEHVSIADVDTLSIAGTRFLADYETMGLVVDDLLFGLFSTSLLVADCLESF